MHYFGALLQKGADSAYTTKMSDKVWLTKNDQVQLVLRTEVTHSNQVLSVPGNTEKTIPKNTIFPTLFFLIICVYLYKNGAH